jgi:hypothetical protein
MRNHSTTLPPNEEAVQILQRYDVTQAHNLVYTYEELKDLGIQPEFSLLCWIYLRTRGTLHPDF